MGRKVTALTAQKRNRERVNVYLDGEFAFGLARIVAAWLQVGQELSEEKIASLQAEDQREAAYQQALRFIQYRERSEAEIQKYLKENKVPEETAVYVMERLQRSGLVNDIRFAQAWVENRNEFHPRSRRALAYELRQKGIDPDAIQSALEDHDDEEMAYQAALKQFRKFKNLEWPEFRQKMLAFLARRGFSYSSAAPAAARVWAEQTEENLSSDDISPDACDASDDASYDEEVDL
jgi:regulatory protein